MTPSKTDHRTRVGIQRSARTETRILEAALGVFAEMGPDAPKIDDFVAAAGISRGTFYNHFESVEVLLRATSQWTTRETVRAIEAALEGIEGPVMRVGTGSRLFLAKAQADRVWSRFVGRVWQLGGRELPERDLEEGLRLGVFRFPSLAAARDLWFGSTREALLRIGSERTPPTYGAHMTEVLLQALGVDSRRIAAVLKHELPELPPRDASSKRSNRAAT
jgi:AcrR family transcriptional regulator